MWLLWIGSTLVDNTAQNSSDNLHLLSSSSYGGVSLHISAMHVPGIQVFHTGGPPSECIETLRVFEKHMTDINTFPVAYVYTL